MRSGYPEDLVLNRTNTTSKMTHIHIDGSQGEGGGQVLRSSLALSLVTGRPFTIDRIRANRAKPGLARQHLTAVQAAAEVGGCDVDSAKVGSIRLDFRPDKVKGGDYTFNVGTAGSATLVLQTVLPALILAEEPSTLTLRGGTHNSMAPPFDFLLRVSCSRLEAQHRSSGNWVAIRSARRSIAKRSLA